jgi:hypothetical protein
VCLVTLCRYASNSSRPCRAESSAAAAVRPPVLSVWSELGMLVSLVCDFLVRLFALPPLPRCPWGSLFSIVPSSRNRFLILLIAECLVLNRRATSRRLTSSSSSANVAPFWAGETHILFHDLLILIASPKLRFLASFWWWKC